MYNAFETDQDRRNYNALLERQAWGRQSNKLINKAVRRGGEWGGIVTHDELMDKLTDGAFERLEGLLEKALLPYTDNQGNITVRI